MTKISNKGNSEPIELSSRLLGTDENGKTKNYILEGIVALINSVAGKDYIQFKFSPNYGSIGLFSSNEAITNPTQITKLFFNKQSVSKEDLTALFTKIDTLQNIVIELRNPSNSNNFAIFKITNITNQTEYFELDVTLYKSFYFGNLVANATYSAYFDVKENFEDKLDAGDYEGTAEDLNEDIQTRVVKVAGKSLVDDTEITKLSHLDDTTDLQKPISTDTAAALALKLAAGGYVGTAQDLENAITAAVTGVTGQALVPSSPAFAGTGIASGVALEPGTYTNFGGVVVNANSIAVISRDASNAYSITQTALVLTGYLQKTDIIDSITSTETQKPASANSVRLLGTKKANLKAGVNKFNKTKATPNTYMTEDGTEGTQANHYLSAPIDVIAGEVYYVSPDLRFLTFFDALGGVVAGGKGSPFSGSYTIPAGVVSKRVTVGDSVDINDFQISLGNLEKPYEDYKETVPQSELPVVDLAQESESALQLKSDVSFRNVALFNTLQSANTGEVSIVKDSDGALITQIGTGWYMSLNTLQDLVAGDKYQVSAELEILEINCSSIKVIQSTYFSDGFEVREYFKSNEGLKTTFTIKEKVASGSNFTSGINIEPQGTKLNSELGYYAKIRIKNISIISYNDDVKNIPSILEVFPNIKEGLNYLTNTEVKLYNQIKNGEKYKNYDLVNLSNIDKLSQNINKTIVTNNVNFNPYFDLYSELPHALSGTSTGYFYYKVKFRINSFNADYWRLVFRGVDGDEYVKYTKKDIGLEHTFTFVRKATSNITTLQTYLLVSQELLTTNETAWLSNNGLETSGSITLLDAEVYYSEKYIPENYHNAFFSRENKERFVDTYKNIPVKKLKMNLFGDSITEHNYAKYLGIEGYDFDISIYGLRGPVSTYNTTGACDTFDVMSNDADIVVSMFGTHDVGYNTPIGSIGTLDKNTFIGAYEVLLRGLIGKYPNKLIAVGLFPQRNVATSDKEFFEQKTLTDIPFRNYLEALIKLCQQYSVPYFDFWSESGANPYNMGGLPNLYVSGTSTDNQLISTTGVESTDNTFFTSSLMDVEQGKIYGTPTVCYFSEYTSGNIFIRRNTSPNMICYLSPTTAKVRVSVSKSEFIVDGTPTGSSISRFVFADLNDARMQDRVHPDEVTKRNMSGVMARVLKPILDNKFRTSNYKESFFDDAD